MDEKVKNYLEERKETIRKEKQGERDKILISLGLYNEEKVYADPKISDVRYPYNIYDKEKENYYYIKKCAVKVSDAEYDEIVKVLPDREKSINESISIGEELSLKKWGVFLIVIGLIDLLGGLIGGAAALNWVVAAVGISCFFVCMILKTILNVVANISTRINQINYKIK